MIKVIILFASLFSFTLSNTEHNAQIEYVEVEFSNQAIGIESGQPIFTVDTKIWVSNPTDEPFKLFINEDEKEMSEKKVEISGLDKGTYTLMIVGVEKNDGEKRTVGFTIQ